MHNSLVRCICFMVFVLGVFLGGCGREQVTPIPTLTAIRPPTGVQGVAALAVTLDGTNFAPGSTITVGTPGGITVTNVNVVSSSQITATFAILSTATVGPRSITVTSQGQTTNAVTFTVTAPPLPAPVITSTNPANGATGVPINQTITATFNRAMNPATINTTTFTLNQGTATGTAITGTVTYAGNTASFKPTVNLLPSTTYFARVTSGAQDTFGNALAATSPVPNPWSFTTGLATDILPPTITLTNPVHGASGVPINQAVSATFSKPMDPTTINGTTFTVTSPGPNPVAGTVTYNAASRIATFTPTLNFSPGITYQATVTTGAKDLIGNALAPGAVPNPWIFSVGTGTAVSPVPLGRASTFGAFGRNAGITNQGILTVINGDIGTTAASTLITGFHDLTPNCTYTETPLNVGTVNGTIYTAPPNPTPACTTEGTAATLAIATTAAADALTAFNALVAMPGGTDPSGPGGELGGLTLTPGVYKAALGSFKITGTDLTLNAQGDPNAVFVFQMSSSLTVGLAGPTGARSIILLNGAQAKNVFWQVGSAATINSAGGGTFAGTIISSATTTFSTAGNTVITTLNGRALALNAAVTMVNTVITVPAP